MYLRLLDLSGRPYLTLGPRTHQRLLLYKPDPDVVPGSTGTLPLLRSGRVQFRPLPPRPRSHSIPGLASKTSTKCSWRSRGLRTLTDTVPVPHPTLALVGSGVLGEQGREWAATGVGAEEGPISGLLFSPLPPTSLVLFGERGLV